MVWIELESHHLTLSISCMASTLMPVLPCCSVVLNHAIASIYLARTFIGHTSTWIINKIKSNKNKDENKSTKSRSLQLVRSEMVHFLDIQNRRSKSIRMY